MLFKRIEVDRRLVSRDILAFIVKIGPWLRFLHLLSKAFPKTWLGSLVSCLMEFPQPR